MNLSEKFNQQEFINWIEKFFPDFSSDYRKVDVPQGFTGVKSISTLGESNLGVRVFLIETEKDPSGRKIGLAKESFNLIKNYGTPNALIAYYSKESSKWRLSLLTSTPEWSEGKIITKLSNPKRQSYVLGEDAKVNTPTRFLLKREAITDINDLKSRFSLEVVNKEFYKEISQAFTKLISGQLKLPSVPDKSQILSEFAVRLIGRVIFCWFLREKKGPDGTALMPKELLSLEAIEKNPDYYHKVLEPIFFEVLNQPAKSRKDLFYGKPYSHIPYLNGGLFSPHKPDDFYERKNGDLQSRFHNTLVIPDSWFVELFETLETYNFTIDENTSFDEELSIDPEMLGRIFENLLAEINPETGESARKSTGSYYTPRVIVDYMVDESLLLYLKQQTGVEENKLRAIISYDLTDDNQYPLDDSEKQKVIDALEKIKILDPACGSGAFPIGALQKMVFILQQVDPEGQLWFKKQIQHTSPEIRRVLEREFTHKNFDYIRKLGVIRENIYGIDIQPIATEISRLRCFLTLVVDERIDDSLENRGIEPLPNLDFKFVTANSLVALPSSGKQVQFGLFEDSEGISELKEIRDMFFNASGSEREMLKLQFVQSQNKMFQKLINEGLRGHADLTTKLTSWDPFSHKASDWFDPEWMFGIKDGFDVVIANPPYIEFKKLSPEAKKSISNYLSAKGKYDIYVVFIEFASNMLKTKGVLTFINPTTFMQKDFGQEIRKFIKTNLNIVSILDFNDFQVFSDATNYTGVFIFQKIINDNYVFDYHHYSNSKKKIDYQEFVQSLQKNSSAHFKKYIEVSNIELKNRRWLFKDDTMQKLLHKIEKNSVSLYQISESIFQGIASGKDEVFYVRQDEIHRSNLENEILHPLVKGKDIKAYSIEWSGTYVVYPYNEDSSVIPEEHLKAKYPKIYQYLLKNKDKLSGRGYFDSSTKLWYELWNQRQNENFKKLRIVVPEISDNNNFALTNEFFGNTKTYHIILKENKIENYHYILGLLNSKLIDFYYKNNSTPHAGGFFAYKTQFLKSIPIKYSSDDESKAIIETVKKILSLTENSDYLTDIPKQNQVKEYRRHIDIIVNRLYDLDHEEIQKIEDYYK